MNTVLIVEDNPRNLKLVRDILRVKGYPTLEAMTAADGLRIAREQQPALILLDIQLPDLDGISALSKLRADPLTRTLRVVAVTASVMPDDQEKILASGFDAYITKPIGLKSFLETVEKIHRQADGRLTMPNKILVVDDIARNVKLLADVLTANGYAVLTAGSGVEALKSIYEQRPDLVLLDVMMPGMTGYDVCKAIRFEPSTALLPVVLVTALDPAERVQGLEAGADDFLTKPIHQAELLARVRSLLRIKNLQDEVLAQRTQLAEWNRTLEQRVADGIAEVDRLSRLKRFLSPQVVDLILASGAEDPLSSHRSEITVVFLDLRNYTAFAESADPEEVMGVLKEYHRAMGKLIMAHRGTVERFAGDMIMVFFNDPVPIPDPAQQAIRMALAMHVEFAQLARNWEKRGYDLGMGIGMAQGYATLGAIGFEGRLDYGAIGTVCALGARLCAQARSGQTLVPRRLLNCLEDMVEAESIGELELKGFHRPVPTFNVQGLKSSG